MYGIMCGIHIFILVHSMLMWCDVVMCCGADVVLVWVCYLYYYIQGCARDMRQLDTHHRDDDGRTRDALARTLHRPDGKKYQNPSD